MTIIKRDCIDEEEDSEIYDYENAISFTKRYSDFKDRMVLPELAENIEETRKEME
jgi:hypothetical protein